MKFFSTKFSRLHYTVVYRADSTDSEVLNKRLFFFWIISDSIRIVYSRIQSAVYSITDPNTLG